MRLWLVTQDFPPDVGGIQTYAAELAARLAPRCERFAVLAPRRPAASAADGAPAYPVRRLPPSRPDLLPLSALVALPGFARRMRLDATLHTQWQTAGAALLARQLTGYPHRVVVAAHGRELLFHPLAASPARAVYDRMRRFVLTRADRCLPVSRYTAGLLETLGVDPARMTVVSNGTDPDVFYPEETSTVRRHLGMEDRKVLLTVARLVPGNGVNRKGVDLVLRALPALAREVPEAMYLVAGDGPDRARLEALARTLGVTDRVRFLGFVPHARLRSFYNACDVFVMPSRHIAPDVEGFGLVFLEANACGKPVIGARTGGIPDAVVHEETGLLVPPDNAAALAAAATRLLQDDALACTLGAQGRRRVLDRLTWDHAARRIHDAVRDVGPPS